MRCNHREICDRATEPLGPWSLGGLWASKTLKPPKKIAPESPTKPNHEALNPKPLHSKTLHLNPLIKLPTPKTLNQYKASKSPNLCALSGRSPPSPPHAREAVREGLRSLFGSRPRRWVVGLIGYPVLLQDSGPATLRPAIILTEADMQHRYPRRLSNQP